MAKEVKELKKETVKVRALESLTKFGYGYLEGAEFEVSKSLAELWVETKSVEILK